MHLAVDGVRLRPGWDMGLRAGPAWQGAWRAGLWELEPIPAAASLGQGLTALGSEMGSCGEGRPREGGQALQVPSGPCWFCQV